MVRIWLLGELKVEVDGLDVEIPRGRARSLFCWLAVNRGSHRRADVAARFWPEILDANARASLRTALWSLRRMLGDSAEAALVATRDRVGLVGGAGVWTDLAAFEERMTAGDHAGALELDRGPLLDGLDDEWALEAREEHARQLLDALEALAAAAEADGDLQRALTHTRRQLEIDPLAEEVYRELIRRLDLAGDRVRAIDAYERLAERLRAELGLAPSKATRDLVARLRPGPAQTIQTRVPPRPAIDGAAVPPGLTAAREQPLVGRTAELEALRQELIAVRGGGPSRFVLLSGETGIGKTRLLAELALEAAERGTTVLFGRAEREALTACQPLLQALAGFSGPGPAAQVPRRDPEEVAARLGDLCGRGPVLLALEHLQWADDSTLALLARLLGPDPPNFPGLFVVGTCRSEELRSSGSLVELAEAVGAPWIELEGLAPAEIEKLCRQWSGEGMLSATVHAQASGNPLFARELVRQPALVGAGPPSGLRATLERRLSMLGEECRRVLAIAAVIGRSFELRVLDRLTGLGPERLAELLEQGLGADLVFEDEGAAERFSFRQALVREALLAQLSRSRRARIHARVAEALEELDADELGAAAAHLCEAGPAGDRERAVELAMQAAGEASERRAYGEAVELYNRALSVLPDGDRRRSTILIRRAVDYQRLEHLLFLRSGVRVAPGP